MRRLFLLLFLLLPVALRAQKPIVLSVADLMPNHELDSAVVRDTNAARAYLDALPQNYATLATHCIQLRTRVQQMLTSLENDYRRDDTLLWLDTHIVVNDYERYAPRLRAVADYLGRMSLRYTRMEQQRVEAEKEAARQRALEESRRQQEERNAQAVALKQNIDRHHRSVLSACDGTGITDKAKIKDLKDLYYSYLMVYNKYDLSLANATQQTLDLLDELNRFQLDVLDNLLSPNSLTNQIENFKNQLKARCEKENTDVYRSYSRVFKHTSVPISFADLNEYEDYITRLRSIIAVQQRYMETIDLRIAINQNSDQIQRLYNKRFRDIVVAYKETLRTINTLPSFTTTAESVSFVSDLQEFVNAQQLYIDTYPLLEGISLRSDSIVSATQSSQRDVAASYRELRASLIPIPTFRNTADGQEYLDRLDRAVQVQRLYQQTVALRNDIARLDDSITARRRDDRILWSGYSTLKRGVSLTPNFASIDHGRRFIDALVMHRNMQRTVLQAQQSSRAVNSNADRITGKGNSYRHIARAYQRLEKTYQTVSEVNSLDALNAYAAQCSRIAAMQEAFFRLLASDLATDADNKLRNEVDTDRISIVVGLK